MRSVAFQDPEFDEAIRVADLRFFREPLSWYVDKLQRGETFSLVRYGDGELACMLGAVGKNTDGCDYSRQLGDDLRYSLTRTEGDFYYGMQRVLPGDVVKFRKVRPAGRPWLDSEVFGRALLDGELYPLIQQLKGMTTTIVGNQHHAKMAWLLGSFRHVLTPECNTYTEKDRLIDYLLDHCQRPAVYLFSCGMTAKVMIAQLHGRLGEKSWLIDVGHLWDVFCGRLTREELKTVTPEILWRNLEGP